MDDLIGDYPRIRLDEEMYEAALKLKGQLTINRTVTSADYAVVGVLGEFAFVQWLLGDWRSHLATLTKGKSDIADRIEIKTSAFSLRQGLHLMVREDYALKRRPEAYVQVVIDIPAQTRELEPGRDMVLLGWCRHERVIKEPPRVTGSKTGVRAGYRTFQVPAESLEPMESFPFRANEVRKAADRAALEAGFRMMRNRRIER